MRKIIVAILLIYSFSIQAQIKPVGILLNLNNANIRNAKDFSLITAEDSKSPVELTFQTHTCIGINREDNKWYVFPLNKNSGKINVNTNLWILPESPISKDNSYMIKVFSNDSVVANIENDKLKVKVYSNKFELHKSEVRPHSDCFNNRYLINIKDGDILANTLAGFYWGTMLQSVIEKTKAKDYPYSSGYVISTLNPRAYAGSYPDVDHEFQIKGRLAFASDLDIDIVKRMIELQFKLMQADPEELYRNPCAVQPNGTREYHVRRNSQNNEVNAEMFLVTGNIEVLEESFQYYKVTKDTVWLNQSIENLEKSAEFTISNIDQYGRVWSDVYYEDQVMKDGRETMSGALAAHTFQLLSQLENVLNRKDKSIYYSDISKKIATALIQPYPQGFWDETEQRFVDWVDRNGVKHDHIHLLANILPVIFEYTTDTQTKAVVKLVNANLSEFQRFPSFMSANVAAYEKSEIGDGGPYDLCAAGRYWYWDAAYWKWCNNNNLLNKQLKSVALAAIKDSLYMGERYDMNHVYYIDNKDWHGAEKYYEYPCVYTSLLIDNFLGIKNDIDVDLYLNPHINNYGDVEFRIPNYDIKYTYNKKGFILKNLSSKTRSFKVDLSALYSDKVKFKLVMKSKSNVVAADTIVKLLAQEEAKWILLR